MKTINLSLWIVSIVLLVACSSIDEEQMPMGDGSIPNTAVLRFEGDIQRFDATRATTADWDDGATLYIQYQTTNGLVDGIAVYSQSKDEWTVDYYGTITKGLQAKCEVYYFENPASTAMTSVSLNAQSAVFADAQATYLYKDGTITLRAHLKPQTGRIRFKGTPGYQFTFTGLKWYSGYNIAANTLSLQSGQLTLTVGQDGYTSYISGVFADASARQLSVQSSDDAYTFRKSFDESVLAMGKSGYIYVPTIESRNGWQTIETDKDPLLCPDAVHPHLIDMGTGVKFACCNVGASTPSDYGDYFAWGETATKNNYTWGTYKWSKGSSSSLTKYCNSSIYGTVDTKTQLEIADDAARANWGGTWRMPTIDELTALNDKCTWKWTTINDVVGYKVTATNGNKLFLPAAGYRNETGLNSDGSSGCYWSSSLYPSSLANCARVLYSHSNGHNTSYSSVSRCCGLSVRPVTD